MRFFIIKRYANLPHFIVLYFYYVLSRGNQRSKGDTDVCRLLLFSYHERGPLN